MFTGCRGRFGKRETVNSPAVDLKIVSKAININIITLLLCIF